MGIVTSFVKVSPHLLRAVLTSAEPMLAPKANKVLDVFAPYLRTEDLAVSSHLLQVDTFVLLSRV